MIFDLAATIHGTCARVVHIDSDGRRVVGNLLGTDLLHPLTQVTVDSRTVVHDSLFVALPGDRADGNEYVGDALRRGARACLVSSQYDRTTLDDALQTLASEEPGPRLRRYLLLVDDPLRALQSLAAHWRGRSGADVIGITGSIGKTTTKEIVASLLGTTRRVLKSEDNFNTEIGLPLTLLRLRQTDEVAILEMGMYALGDISTLARIASPRIGIVTGVEPVHLERLASIERIARAKSELVAELPTDGLAIVNGDNRWTRAMAEFSGPTRSVKVGFAEDCDYRASHVITHGLSGIRFTVHAEGRDESIDVPLPGAHLVHAVLAAIATAREIGMSWPAIIDGMAAVHIEGRQRMVRGPENLLVIDDSYNAAPQSVLAALEVLRQAPGERIAILGDMLELGPDEEAAHRLVGVRAATIADGLVVTGRRAAWIGDAALAAGMPPDKIIRTGNNHDAAIAARSLLHITARRSDAPEPPAATVLVKGSRGMAMEQIVQEMTKQ